MLAPKRIKFRKMFKGRTKGIATRGSRVSFGEFGLMSLEPGWITNRQIEASRVAIPLVRPLNILRNLIRFGASIGQAPVL
jgi:ribosomal protein L16